jgi:hypothetical protein
MHMHDGRIDHLYLSIVSGSQGIHNLVPDASPAPAYEAIVAGRVWTEALRQVAPRGA